MAVGEVAVFFKGGKFGLFQKNGLKRSENLKNGTDLGCDSRNDLIARDFKKG